jgi:UDPglucose--hexose-1-phosphate uridylyltransferase
MVTELRLDPLSGRWAAIRPQRADRPAAFVDRMAWPTEQRSTCPFCKEHADDEQVLAETTDGGNWTSRVVANRYPAFDTDEPFVVFNKGPVFTEATAGGTHEVVVFSPDHDKSFSELDDHEVADVMALLKERLTAHALSLIHI